MAVSKRLRYEVLRRDNYTCRYCGAAAPDVKLTVDHVVPVSLGGSDEPANLVAACADCNSGKTSSSPDAPLVEDVAQDALRWSQAMERAAEHQRHQERELTYMASILEMLWREHFVGDLYVEESPEGWTYNAEPEKPYHWLVRDENRQRPDGENFVLKLCETEDEAYSHREELWRTKAPPRPDDWRASLPLWIAAGISEVDLESAVKVAARASHVSREGRFRYFCGVIWRTLEDRQRIAADLLKVDEEAGDG